VIDETVTLALADGTYTEAVVLDRFVMTGRGLIELIPVAPTPSVTINGSTVTTLRGTSQQTVVSVTGAKLAMGDVTISGPAANGIVAKDGATVSLLHGATIHGNLTQAITVWDHSILEYAGAVTISGWTSRGIQAAYQSLVRPNGPGTLTVSGPFTTGSYGLQLITSEFIIRWLNTACHVVVSDCQFPFQLGYRASYVHEGTNGTTTVTNRSSMSGSAMAQVADASGWGTKKPLTVANFPKLFDLYALSFGEVNGPKSLTNVPSFGTAVQSSVIDVL
jgi:hypothetical protein